MKNKAKLFDLTHNARTYLIFDIENMAQGILAYFSLSFKEISLEDYVSKTQTKKLDGISKNAEKIRVFLLGQIGKNDFAGNPVNSLVIFEEVYNILIDVQKKIGGRTLLLECENNPKLIEIYEKQGFEILQEQSLVQMFRILDFKPEVSE